MTNIPVYDITGEVLDVVSVSDNLSHVSGRTSKSDRLYYKGVGSYYKGHAALFDDGVSVKSGRNAVFYYGDDYVNPYWVGKFGVFRQRYQPYFSDFIGTCGKKELSIIKNSQEFYFSSVAVVDCVCYDEENAQMYFVLEYKKQRTSFMGAGDEKKLVPLLGYMLQENWNFPWDKAAIRDVDVDGYVTDVADIFMSTDLKHKFGTVYSILYSLHALDVYAYTRLLNYLGLPYAGIKDIVFVVNFILSMNRIKIQPKLICEDRDDLYCHLVANILLRGKNCAAVETQTDGDKVMLEYVDRFTSQVPLEKRRIIEV